MTGLWGVLELKPQLCCFLFVWPQARHLISLCLGFPTRLLWGLREAKHIRCFLGARHRVSNQLMWAVISSPPVTLYLSDSGFCLDSNHLKSPVTNQHQTPSLIFAISLTLSKTFHVQTPFSLGSQAPPHHPDFLVSRWPLGILSVSQVLLRLSKKFSSHPRVQLWLFFSFILYTFSMTVLSYSGYKLPEPVPLLDCFGGGLAFQKTPGALSAGLLKSQCQ